MKCKFPSCEKAHRSNGLCGGHYQQYVKRGMEGLEPLRERLKIDRTAQCLVDGCNNLVEKKHLCGKHYQKLKLYGDPLGVAAPKGPEDLQVKLMRKLAMGGENECWAWQGATNPNGYGVLAAREIGQQLAHRVSYVVHFGQIPNGQCVLHKCDNRVCCNPNHLFLGDNNDNTQDMIAKRRDKSFGYKRRLNDNDVRLIRDETIKTSCLAEKFGITSSMVSLIRLRKSYKHVSD